MLYARLRVVRVASGSGSGYSGETPALAASKLVEKPVPARQNGFPRAVATHSGSAQDGPLHKRLSLQQEDQQ